MLVIYYSRHLTHHFFPYEQLISVYETPSLILLVTEYCEGGELIPYVTNAFKSNAQGEGGLRTEDVSRISYQLFSAVNHCAKHGVIHRDIKPGEYYVLSRLLCSKQICTSFVLNII